MIAVVVNPEKDPTHYIEDGAIATTHILLAAHAVGLGTCWVGAFGAAYEDDTKRVLGVPPNLRVLSLVSLGYPAEERISTRKDLREIVRYGKYGKKEVDDSFV